MRLKVPYSLIIVKPITSICLYFQLVVLATILACANAGILGAPAAIAYSAAPALSSSYIHTAAPAIAVAHAAPVVQSYAAPVAIQSPSVGAFEHNVYRSLGGAQSVSTYTKAVDSPFSSVRKFDTRITNDALAVAPAIAPVATYAAPAISTYGAPLLTRSVVPAPLVTKAAVAYSPAAVVAHATFTGLGTSYGW